MNVNISIDAMGGDFGPRVTMESVIRLLTVILMSQHSFLAIVLRCRNVSIKHCALVLRLALSFIIVNHRLIAMTNHPMPFDQNKTLPWQQNHW